MSTGLTPLGTSRWSSGGTGSSSRRTHTGPQPGDGARVINGDYEDITRRQRKPRDWASIAAISSLLALGGGGILAVSAVGVAHLLDIRHKQACWSAEDRLRRVQQTSPEWQAGNEGQRILQEANAAYVDACLEAN